MLSNGGVGVDEEGEINILYPRLTKTGAQLGGETGISREITVVSCFGVKLC